MTVDYQLAMVLEGDTEEIKRMLDVVGLYTGDRPQSFSFVQVSGKEIDLKNLTNEIVKDVTVSGKVLVTASGPWGDYGQLDEVDLFREMSEAVPTAAFSAEITGSGSYEEQSLICELKDGMLNIKTYFKSNDADGQEYAKDFVKKIPLAKFKKLFRIEGDYFDKKSYLWFAEQLTNVFWDGFENADYEEFVLMLEECDAETKLDESEFREIVLDKLKPLGIMTFNDFVKSCNCGERNEYIYDPVSKKYVH